MTNAQDADRRFTWIAQQGGPVVTWSDPYRRLTAAGLEEWSASSFSNDDEPSEIYKHVTCNAGLRMLTVRLTRHASPGEGAVRWESTLKIAGDRYVRVHGSAAEFPAALAQCEEYAHESRQIGALTWWLESEDHWVSWLGPFNLTARKFTRPGKDGYWHFESVGEASSLEEAALLASLGRIDAALGQDR